MNELYASGSPRRIAAVLQQYDIRYVVFGTVERVVAGVSGREALLEERGHLGDDIVVARRLLHRARLSLHVHQAQRRAGVGDRPRELGIAPKRGHVVDELRAERERVPRDLGAGRVDRDAPALEPLEHRDRALRRVLPRYEWDDIAARIHRIMQDALAASQPAAGSRAGVTA